MVFVLLQKLHQVESHSGGFNLHLKYHFLLSFQYINSRYSFLWSSLFPFIFVLWATEKEKARNSNYIPKFYFSSSFQSFFFLKYEYSWEWLCKNNFQCEIKTVTFAFAFCQHEILKRRVKNSFELQQTPQNEVSRRWFMKSTATSSFDFRAGISLRSITRKLFPSHWLLLYFYNSLNRYGARFDFNVELKKNYFHYFSLHSFVILWLF